MNLSRFSVSTPCCLVGMYQRHAMPFSFYPPIPYSQASDHSVTVGVMSNMLFIGTPFSVTYWRIFIQRCGSCLFQDLISCGTHLFPLFRRLRSLFRKYLDGVIMCLVWLSLTMGDYSLSVFVFVEARYALIYFTRAVYFSLGSNTRRKPIWMSQPRQVLCFASWPSPASFWSEKRSYHFRVSLECSSLNMVWMTNKAAFFARSTQHQSSMVMVMISSMNIYAEASFASIFTSSCSALTSGSEAGR